MMPKKPILVTDFDGTITSRDFYSCAVELILSPEDIKPWQDYTSGRISHFEALRRIFSKLRVEEEKLEEVFSKMLVDPELRQSVQKLETAGWEIVVVSNGCLWYIERLLRRSGVTLQVHANPGSFDPEKGLVMELPADSPFFSPELGISKRAVVEDALKRADCVAFAGDGRPDFEPSTLVSPELRFARSWLSEQLSDAKEQHHYFKRWSDIVRILLRRNSWRENADA